MDDPHDLARFIEAQERNYARALSELRAGQKRSHWMWYIFPQYAGLGLSSISRHYAIKIRAEAEAYLQHPILGPRLIECGQAVLDIHNRSADAIFGSPDDLKLHSCATLFAHISPAGSVFEQILQKYFAGKRDERTIELVSHT
jgi:uncharacterized protein (DUF1810 family)